jgi:hypothetical protein
MCTQRSSESQSTPFSNKTRFEYPPPREPRNTAKINKKTSSNKKQATYTSVFIKQTPKCVQFGIGTKRQNNANYYSRKKQNTAQNRAKLS